MLLLWPASGLERWEAMLTILELLAPAGDPLSPRSLVGVVDEDSDEEDELGEDTGGERTRDEFAFRRAS